MDRQPLHHKRTIFVVPLCVEQPLVHVDTLGVFPSIAWWRGQPPWALMRSIARSRCVEAGVFPTARPGLPRTRADVDEMTIR